MASILETLETEENVSEFLSLVRIAGLEDMLRNRGPFTVFVPGDEAVRSLPAEALQALKETPERLADMLRWHVVVGELFASEVPSMRNPTIKTMQGAELDISRIGEDIVVNDARIARADIECDNGVVHIIESVLMPQMAEVLA
ncbi:fasciclin domain-containing protein [Methanoculleus frigidifontis]|nr:fasciclin domain-containing protein [Methanoculleus sp. FWC-SCC1]